MSQTADIGDENAARGGAAETRGNWPPSHIEFRELRYFVAVAEELNFTRAADRLHISEQGLSAAIHQLELRIGVVLFERTSRRVKLTTVGEALRPKAEQAISAAEQAALVAHNAARGLIGTLELGISRSAFSFGAAIVEWLRNHSPEITVEVRTGFSQPLLEDLLEQRLSAAVLFCPERRLELAYQRLSNEPAVASMNGSHALAGRRSLRVVDLRNETVTLPSSTIGQGLRDEVAALCQRAGFVPASVTTTGYMVPAGIRTEETLGVVAEKALDGIPLPDDLVLIPLLDTTLPFDLVWSREWESPILATLRRAAEATTKL